MKYYREIACWENQRRLKELLIFRDRYMAYVNGRIAQTNEECNIDEEELANLRFNINLTVSRVTDVVQASGIPVVITRREQGFLGERRQGSSLFQDLFILDQANVHSQYVVDTLERAIGVYLRNRGYSMLRTINPLWWTGKAIRGVVRIPFSLIGAAGFDADKAESSILGRLLKAMIVLIPVAAALLTILGHIELLDVVKGFIGIGS